MVHAPEGDGPEAGTTALEKLAVELGGRGFTTTITVPDGHLPYLTASNPEASALSETILASQGCYWWSWAERIGPVDDIAGVASRIAQVLAVVSGGVM
jgi:hypothetical protein